MKTYFDDKTVFDNADGIKEHVQWLLPNKDEEANEEADDDDNIDVEEIVCRWKKKFVGAPFLYENGLIGPVEEPVRKLAGSHKIDLIFAPVALGVSFKSARPQHVRNPF